MLGRRGPPIAALAALAALITAVTAIAALAALAAPATTVPRRVRLWNRDRENDTPCVPLLQLRDDHHMCAWRMRLVRASDQRM